MTAQGKTRGVTAPKICYLTQMIFYALIWIVLGIALAAMTCHTFWIMALQGLVILLGIIYGWINRTQAYRVLGAMCLLFLGIYYFQIRYDELTAFQLSAAHIKKPIQITGVVTEIPDQEKGCIHFLLKWDTKMHPLLRLNWYKPYPTVSVGDRWQFTVSLKPAWGLHNFGAFDYQQWLIFHGISATGTVLSSSPSTLLARGKRYLISRWREHLLLLVQQAITDPDVVGLITALTIGSHALIESTQWPVFQRTGTNHLMAISGLHIGMVAGFGFLWMGLVGRFFTRLLLVIPLQSLQAGGAIVSTLVYGVMSGFSLPTQRAVIMVLCVMCSLLIRRSFFLWHRLIFAFCCAVLLDPFCFFSISLWMSFSSVFWIAYLNSARFKPYKKLAGWWRLQIALCVGLMPMTLLAFHQVSFMGILANLLAVPWVSFFVVPLCLLAAISSLLSRSCAIFLFHLSGLFMKPLWHYLVFLSDSPGAVWMHHMSEPWVIGLGVVGVFVFLLPRGIPGRYMGLYLCLPLFFYQPALPAKHELWLTMLDVGQGLSLVIQTQHHTLLYDAGPKSYFGFDAGESVVMPYLQYRGITHLDMMMISHGDNDHIGGAYAVLHDIPVQEVISSIPTKFSKALSCYQGEHWEWDHIQFSILWPLKDKPYEDNNSSCVLRITDGKVRILLTGDIENPVEQWLVENNPTGLASDIVVVPHHGSMSSSIESFVNLIKPKIALFSTGFYNRYHFPSITVVARYHQLGSIVYNTASEGAVFIKMNNSMIRSVKFARMSSFSEGEREGQRFHF